MYMTSNDIAFIIRDLNSDVGDGLNHMLRNKEAAFGFASLMYSDSECIEKKIIY